MRVVDLEAGLALAKSELGRVADARREADRLSRLSRLPRHYLPELWLSVGDIDQAKIHCLNVYRYAYGDGEPYVFYYELNRARALLERLAIEVPRLPQYDSAKDEKFPWEEDLLLAMAKLRDEQANENASSSN
jgi:hypothetical protein